MNGPWRYLSLSRISGVYVLIGLIIIFSIWLPDIFPTVNTARNIITGQTVVAIVTIGLVFALAGGVYDLSVGYTVSLVSIVFARMLKAGHPIPISIVVALICALCIGLLNSFVIVVLGIESLIGTLGTGSILSALTYVLSNQTQIVGLPTGIGTMTSTRWHGIPISIAYLVVLAIAAWWLLEHTPFGRRLYSVGFGRDAARLAGVRTEMCTVGALLITSLMAGIGGVILTGIVGSASPDIGPSYLLPAFAAAFLGATQITPGRMNVLGALIATYLLATGSTGLQLAGAEAWVTLMFNGVALILAVGLTVQKARLDTRRTRRRTQAAVIEEQAALAGARSEAASQ